MSTLGRDFQKSKGSLQSNEELFIENDGNKKIKLEDGSHYNPEIFDEEIMDSDGNDNMDFTKSNLENLEEFQPKRWSSTYKDRSKGRLDNSLSVLTRKFIQLIKNSPNHTVDLNDAVRELNVQKRRIYDITNVLEGIGYIRKVLKNKIKWVGRIENECDPKLLAQELESLIIEEKEVMKWTTNLREMLADLAKDESTNQFSFVTFDDIKAVDTLPKEGDQPFLVIRAPKGTLLEVPDAEPDGADELPYKMTLTSENEQIFIYVVSNESTEVPQEA